jgi:hypothetical protein
VIMRDVERCRLAVHGKIEPVINCLGTESVWP